MTPNYSLTPVGYIVAFLLLYFVSKSKLGHALIYFTLLLVLVFTLLVNYRQIDKVMFKDSSSFLPAN